MDRRWIICYRRRNGSSLALGTSCYHRVNALHCVHGCRPRRETMTENALYEQLARYMNLQHPDVPYHFDLSGLWTPSHKARNLYGRLNRRAWPDLFIGIPRFYYKLEGEGTGEHVSDVSS